ncbi:hypothetical protein K435DRAFT_806296 [Dendrothele bispora CBS 962.96]|uniref:Uncharacterized protein n=1 Tax=Dendrothele bispora (strain CBS 962.96) TaxID=1314807 RepID=A0A4S8L8B9_DENBC|nr:hypothetical protein K435DRAFT_806296 [Dendrothele bispora CBS 962.96]
MAPKDNPPVNQRNYSGTISKYTETDNRVYDDRAIENYEGGIYSERGGSESGNSRTAGEQSKPAVRPNKVSQAKNTEKTVRTTEGSQRNYSGMTVTNYTETDNREYRDRAIENYGGVYNEVFLLLSAAVLTVTNKQASSESSLRKTRTADERSKSAVKSSGAASQAKNAGKPLGAGTKNQNAVPR